eukprot:CAMPEP_0170733736 /NCGR_PEP_ID=MMETSP0437-20130122/2227_1 /TAXON_ID=0 /ORGANISM="Sexangularia sp." /LENGTH=134 /DNA_ID=CAMNT_0011072025 /DNA_START=44 /DNA_END=448 /DNA_ORIENTATION=-
MSQRSATLNHLEVDEGFFSSVLFVTLRSFPMTYRVPRGEPIEMRASTLTFGFETRASYAMTEPIECPTTMTVRKLTASMTVSRNLVRISSRTDSSSKYLVRSCASRSSSASVISVVRTRSVNQPSTSPTPSVVK